MKSEAKKLIEDWRYFCTKINFGESPLDAKAIQFMNTFEKRVGVL